jgi:hypothetical protein
MHTPNRPPSASAISDRRAYAVHHDFERGVFPASPFPALEATREGVLSIFLVTRQFNPCKLV